MSAIGWPPDDNHPVINVMVSYAHQRRVSELVDPEGTFGHAGHSNPWHPTARELGSPKVFTEGTREQFRNAGHVRKLIFRCLAGEDVPPDIADVIRLARDFFEHAEIEAFAPEPDHEGPFPYDTAVMYDAFKRHAAAAFHEPEPKAGMIWKRQVMVNGAEMLYGKHLEVK